MLEASLVKVITPVTVPALGGLKEIVTTRVPPAGMLTGNVGLTIDNPLPDTVPANTFVAAVPGFDRSMG